MLLHPLRVEDLGLGAACGDLCGAGRRIAHQPVYCLALGVLLAGPAGEVTPLVLHEVPHSQRAGGDDEQLEAVLLDAHHERGDDEQHGQHAPLVAPDQHVGQEPEERVVSPVVVPQVLLALHCQLDLLLVAGVGAVPVRVDSQHRRPVGVEEGESEPPREPGSTGPTSVAQAPLEHGPLRRQQSERVAAVAGGVDVGEVLVGLANPRDRHEQADGHRDRQTDDPAAVQHVVVDVEQQCDQAGQEHGDVAADVGHAASEFLVFGAEDQLVAPAKAEDRERVTQVFHHCSRLLGADRWTVVKHHKHKYYTLISVFFNMVL